LKAVLFSSKSMGFDLLCSNSNLKSVLLRPEFIGALVQSIVKDRDDVGGTTAKPMMRGMAGMLDWSAGVDELVKEPKRKSKDFHSSRKRGFGKEFYRHHAKLVKLLYQTLGLQLLPLLKEPLQALLNCPEDKEERTNLATGGVILAGLVRAATSKSPPGKHVSIKSMQDETWNFVMPFFHSFFLRMSIGYCNDWADAVRYCFSNRSLESVRPLYKCLVQKFHAALEKEKEQPTSNTSEDVPMAPIDRWLKAVDAQPKMDEFAGKARWIRLVRAMLIELFEYRNRLLSRGEIGDQQKDVDIINDSVNEFWESLLTAFGNPYQICREEIAKSIVLILVENARGQPASIAVQLRKKQIISIMDKLDLKEAKLAHCWPVTDDGSSAVQPESVGGVSSEEGQDASQDWCLETTIQIVYHCLNFYETFEVADIVLELLPAVLCSQNHKDNELCAMAHRCMKALIKNLRFSQVQTGSCVESQARLITILQRLSNSESWRTRGVISHFAESFAMLHAQTLTSLQVNQVWSILDKSIDDPQPEVQTQGRCGLTTFFVAFAGRIEGGGVKGVAEKFIKISTTCRKDLKKKAKKAKATVGSSVDIDKPAKKQKVVKSPTYVVSALSSVILAFPYDVPDFIIDALMELTNFSSGGEASTRKAARDAINEFRRTHQDNWDEFKRRFTLEQLELINDSNNMPSYFA